jgi:3-hydroxyacyl-[acyl-carrier-protein] dehydratase
MIDAKLIHEGSGFARTAVKTTSGGKPVCNSELTFRVVDFPAGEFIANMQDVAKRIQLPLEAPAHG